MMDLSEFIQSKDVILLDGAMGTRLDDFGLEMGGHNNVTHPQKVLEIHTEYANCGCGCLPSFRHKTKRITIFRCRSTGFGCVREI